MASNTILTFEEANLFCGKESTDNSVSLHLKLSEVKLPAMDELFQEHRSTAAPVALEVNTIFARLECSFTIVGMDPQVYTAIAPAFESGQWNEDLMWFDMYGVVRDQLSGEIIKGHAKFNGRLGGVDPQAWRRGDLFHTACAIQGLRHYELSLDEESLYFWNFFSNTLIVGGVNRTAGINNTLHIPTTTLGLTATASDFPITT